MDDFGGGVRLGALAFSIGGYGYVGTGFNDNYLKDFYRFNPNAAAGKQWEIVNGFGGYKRWYGTAFVIDDVVGRTITRWLMIYGNLMVTTGLSCVILPILIAMKIMMTIML